MPIFTRVCPITSIALQKPYLRFSGSYLHRTVDEKCCIQLIRTVTTMVASPGHSVVTHHKKNCILSQFFYDISEIQKHLVKTEAMTVIQ